MPEGVVGVIHNCSRVSHLIDLYVETGAKCIQFGQDLSIEVAKERVGDKMALMGNLSPIGVISKGAPEEVEEACRDVIVKGGLGEWFNLKLVRIC